MPEGCKARMYSVVTFMLLSLLPSQAFAFHTLTVHDPATGKRLGKAVSSQVLVKFKKSAAPQVRKKALEKVGAKVMSRMPAIGWTQVEIPPGMSVEEALEHYRSDPDVEYVQPNFVYHIQAVVPNDPSLGSQYGLSNINAFAAWEFEKGYSTTTRIAIIDTGIDGGHPDFSGKLDTTRSSWFTFANGTRANEFPQDPCGHGTGVAGVAGAATDNGRGIAGVSWGGRLLSLRLAEENNCTGPSNTWGFSEVSISSAILYAVQVAMNPGERLVINISMGLPEPECGPACENYMVDSVNEALGNNVPVVAAAGNYVGTPNLGVMFPARIEGVIAVGATDINDNIASYSAVGTHVVVSAPGTSVWSTSKDGGVSSWNGTSFSSPHVAGLAALMLAADPGLLVTELKTKLQETADDLGPAGFDTSYGFGRVNAFRALRRISKLAKGEADDFEGDKRAIAFPNPVRFSENRVSFAIPPTIQGSNLEIRLYDMAGGIVRTLHGLTWDGKNDHGRNVASGVYIFYVRTDRGQATGRVAVLH